MKSHLRLVVAFATIGAICAGASQSGHASTIYTYTGQNYTDAEQVGAGPNVFNTTMSVSGSFSLANPLPANTSGFTDIAADVLDFSFFNGHDTLTPVNTDFAHSTMRVRTFGGQITDWDVVLLTSSTIGAPFSGVQMWNAPNLNHSIAPFDEGTFLSQCTHLHPTGRCDSGDGGDAKTLNQPGTWSASQSDSQATPLPAALPLFVGGLGALGLIGWRRKKKAAALAA